MAQGLSGLQIQILARALSNKEQGATEVHVYGREVAADYFGWPLPADFYRRKGNWRSRRLRAILIRCTRPPRVGDDEANRVHAAICRAFRRLEERGLGVRVSGVRTRWSGFRLNDQGLEIAREAVVRAILASCGH